MKSISIVLLLLLSTLLYAQDDSFFFDEEMTEEEDTGLALQVGGKSGINAHFVPDYDDLDDSDKGFNLFLDLDLILETEHFDISGNIDIELDDYDNLEEFPLQSQRHNSSVYLDTLFLRYYHSRFDLEVGLLKPVWGNADGIHVIDVLNPLDYSDPFGPSYLDRKISQQMLKINAPVGENSLLEISYLPKFEGDYISTTGMWQPYYFKTLEDKIYSIALVKGLEMAREANPGVPDSALLPTVEASAELQANSIASTLSIDDSEYFVDSQVAARFSTSVNSVDLGFIYYWGFLKQPTIDPDDVLKTGKLNLIYNRVHTVGADIATQLGLFNLKAEVSYNLTSDIEGDDPAVVNNSFNYIVGFDINLPINNVNLLLQGVGSNVINSSEITEVDPGYRDDDYIDFMLMGKVSDNYINETLFIEISGAYDILNMDYMITPNITYKLNDNLELFSEYMIIGGDLDTDFGQYRDNDTIKLGVEYFF